MLFGGDQCGARIKYEGDAIVQRTPIVVLSNNDCMPSSLAFQTRMFNYKWRTCHYLKALNKKPFPMAFAYLLARWNIISYKDINYDFSDDEMCIFNDERLDDRESTDSDNEHNIDQETKENEEDSDVSISTIYD